MRCFCVLLFSSFSLIYFPHCYYRRRKKQTKVTKKQRWAAWTAEFALRAILPTRSGSRSQTHTASSSLRGRCTRHLSRTTTRTPSGTRCSSSSLRMRTHRSCGSSSGTRIWFRMSSLGSTRCRSQASPKASSRTSGICCSSPRRMLRSTFVC